ncbi:MAG: LEA type 2 family protein [Gammaproteobacteria bacterium]
MLSLPAPAPGRLFFIAVSVLLALALGGCAGMLTRDPIRINVVGIEPLAGQGLEMRFTVKLRLQNPNETAIDYDGVALELELNGKPFASGVSDQKGSVSRFGETVFSVPVTVSAFAAMRQALGLADGAKLDNLPYVLRGKLAGGLFGGMRFTDKGTLSLPGAGKTGE